MIDKQLIKDAVREALHEEVQAFYIDRESHYLQHKWLQDLITYCDNAKSVVGKTIVSIIVSGAIALMVAGFVLRQK